jgi:hypothetical protein
MEPGGPDGMKVDCVGQRPLRPERNNDSRRFIAVIAH